MADSLANLPLAVMGLNVEVVQRPDIASLRYFSPAGPFAQAVGECCGVGLPGTGRAVSAPGEDLLLAWRSPSESLVLAAHAARLATLAAAVSACTDGCLIDLTGAVQVLHLQGERIADLLCRLGGAACIPQPGESRRSRLADVPVLAFSFRPLETELLVDRTFLPHLTNWIRETLLDFADA